MAEIQHSHDAGVNKSFAMRHPVHGEALVGDWQEDEFVDAGWARVPKRGRPAKDAAPDAAE